MKIAFVTNICPHYRVKTFETLARYFDVDYYFFSAGDERYWQRQHGARSGAFRHEYLWGVEVGGTRFTPTLPIELWHGNYDVTIKCILGRFALPVTYLVTRLKRKPFILWTGIWMRLQTPSHRLFFPLTRYIYHHSDAIVVYGEHVKRYLVNEGVLKERIFVAAHAVDNEVYNCQISEQEVSALRRRLGIAIGQKVVLYLGRLEAVKGLTYLLDAFASLHRDDAVLVIAGTGSEQPHLEELARTNGIFQRVRFTGYVQPEDSVRYYALAWVYVLPSITTPVFKEPWGLVVNEAFNQGVPVIATDAVGAAAGGLVQDGVNGCIVPERDTEAIAKSLRLILDNPALRQQMSENAKRKIEYWNNEHMVQGFRDAVAYVLSGR